MKGGSEEDDDEIKKVMRAHPDLTQSNLWQISIPESCYNKTFEHLFYHLLDDKLITLGLYRLKGAVNNSYPFVYTNPEPDTIVTHRDKAFVVGYNIQKYQQHLFDYFEQVGNSQQINIEEVIRLGNYRGGQSLINK